MGIKPAWKFIILSYFIYVIHFQVSPCLFLFFPTSMALPQMDQMIVVSTLQDQKCSAPTWTCAEVVIMYPFLWLTEIGAETTTFHLPFRILSPCPSFRVWNHQPVPNTSQRQNKLQRFWLWHRRSNVVEVQGINQKQWSYWLLKGNRVAKTWEWDVTLKKTFEQIWFCPWRPFSHFWRNVPANASSSL